jgi:hypothetical protein
MAMKREAITEDISGSSRSWMGGGGVYGAFVFQVEGVSKLRQNNTILAGFALENDFSGENQQKF